MIERFCKSNNNYPKQSKLGISSRLDGKILGSEMLMVIDGQVKGEILLNGDLELTENAKISGNVKANKLHIYGKIEGNINAVDSISVEKTAVIQGNINAGIANIISGAIINGQCLVGKNQESKIAN